MSCMCQEVSRGLTPVCSSKTGGDPTTITDVKVIDTDLGGE